VVRRSTICCRGCDFSACYRGFVRRDPRGCCALSEVRRSTLRCGGCGNGASGSGILLRDPCRRGARFRRRALFCLDPCGCCALGEVRLSALRCGGCGNCARSSGIVLRDTRRRGARFLRRLLGQLRGIFERLRGCSAHFGFHGNVHTHLSSPRVVDQPRCSPRHLRRDARDLGIIF
jgi:hypothetical protein